MNETFKAHRFRFAANLTLELLSLVGFGVVVLQPAALSIAYLLLAAGHWGWNYETRVFLSVGVLMGALAGCFAILFWKWLNNPETFPSCFCKAIFVDGAQTTFLLFPNRRMTVSTVGIRLSSNRSGLWLHWNKHGLERKILIYKKVFTKQEFERMTRKFEASFGQYCKA